MISNPSWPVHQGICLEIGLNTIQYRYYNPITKGLDFEGMIEDFKSAPEGSVVIIQTAGHNPTGVDIQKEQWIILKDLFLQKKFVAFFDLSYQVLKYIFVSLWLLKGFATGDIHDDAYALRLFAAENDLPIILAHSFAKNFTLYGERIGCLSTICSSEKEAGEVQSQMKIIARRLYSSPPLQGARIISTILHTKDLYELWLKVRIKKIKSINGLIIRKLKVWLKELFKWEKC